MALVAPSASAINELLKNWEKFASEHYIVYSTEKSVCMRILPQNCTTFARPNVYLCGSALKYVEEFKYLGHFMTEEFSDTKDIQREFHSLYSRGNMLIRKFSFCIGEVKCFFIQNVLLLAIQLEPMGLI